MKFKGEEKPLKDVLIVEVWACLIGRLAADEQQGAKGVPRHLAKQLRSLGVDVVISFSQTIPYGG